MVQLGSVFFITECTVKKISKKGINIISPYFRSALKSGSLTCLKSRTSLSVSGLDLPPLSVDTAEEP